jgi:signal transduction histidine kinase
VGAVSSGFSTAGTQAATDLTDRAQPVARAIYLRLFLAGGLGLLALIASVLVSFWIGRGLVRQLADLKRSALDLAGERLPRVMERLRAGEDVDVSVEAPPIETSGDEIGQVGQAFNTVQRTAITAAVEQARLRHGISDVFRNLARRSQSLLHRQLTLLDTMERRASDPDELGDLYRLDHLTTRMRRHAEGLIILSGAAPGRAWRNPVRLVDVLRASVAEVEDYTRVTVVTMTQAALAGPVVADVIHMIAELVENATMFSPPNTPVRLTGDMVGKGFAVEIEDRGLGLSEEKLAEINDRLSSPPEFDLSDSDQLGLFVAGRLAVRHGIKISMRISPYGGTTAIVLIPRDLVVSEEVYSRDPSAAQASESAVQPTGRHAARSEDIIAAAAVPPTGAHPYATNGGPAGAALADGRLSDDWLAAALADSAAMDTTTGSSTSWFQRAGENGWPEPETSVTADAEDSAASTADLTELGLPRRIRQANLAPQLRETAPQGITRTDSEPDFRSPEETRATMTAIQRGWERGRTASFGISAPEPGEAGVSEPGGSEPGVSELGVSEPGERDPMDGGEE